MQTPILNPSEKLVYARLRSVCARYRGRVGLHSKVRLADVLPINRSGISDELYRFALQSHFDFLVTDSATVPMLAIECDGPHHSEPCQQERDKKKGQLCRWFELPLLRFPAPTPDSQDEDLNCIQTEVADWLHLNYGPPPPPPPPPPKPPIPPKPPGHSQANRYVVAGWVGGVVFAGFLVAVVVLVTTLIRTPSGKRSPRVEPSESAARVEPNPVVAQQANPPIKTSPSPKPKTISSDPATERQLNLLKLLIRRKGWDNATRDDQVTAVLGYARTLEELSKREASTLIDAWDDRKK